MTDPHRQAISPVHWGLWTLVGLILAIEGWTWLANQGWVGLSTIETVWSAFYFDDPAFDRAVATGAGLGDVLARMVGHALLHAGWLHALMNAAGLLALGNLVVRHAGIGATLLVLVVSAFTGALFYGLIAESGIPMVGASGGVFGLLGVYLAWQDRVLRLTGQSRVPTLRAMLGLVALNLLLAFWTGGYLAWEAHLGGFIAGFALAQFIVPRLRA